MTFQEAAVESAQLYYDYLKENGEGVIEYKVKSIIRDQSAIKKNEYWLQLYKKPKFIDSLEIKINKNTYSFEQIKPSVFDNYHCMLKVILSKETMGVFDDCDPASVIVFSDLKFLVRRVMMWYKVFGNKIRLPEGSNIVEPVENVAFKKQASTDQIEAIIGALSNPFSYIWGAPGTGKTQFVLSRAVLAYIKEKKRVLITAPTNNAVEQTLYGLIPVLKEAGFDCNEILIRIGTASSNFVASYPGVCEDAGFSAAISEVNDIIVSLRYALDELKVSEQLFEEYLEYQSTLLDYLDNKNIIEGFLSRLTDEGERVSRIHSSIGETDLSIDSLLDKEKQYKEDEEFYNRQASDLIKKTKRFVFFFSPRSQKEEIKRDIDAALEKARYYEKKYVELSDELVNQRTRKSQLNDDLRSQQSLFDNILSDLVSKLEFSPNTQSIAKKTDIGNYVSQEKDIKSSIEKEIEEIRKKGDKYSTVEEKTKDYYERERQGLLEQLARNEEKKQKLEASTSSKQIGNCLIVACTIDACINRLPPSEENFFSHVFLDEAGYSSLIKAAALTAYGDRLTFLGDHMQLPPICEADDEKIESGKNLLIALWAQSSLFLESIFIESPEQICIDYLRKKAEPFCYMEKYDLLNSFRFGHDLANVLAQDVYDKDFSGNGEINTKIYYINAPKKKEKVKRTSTSECEEIKKVLEKHQVLKRTSGIIAPYKNQVKLLGDMAKTIYFPEDNVVTIHQSQGREWNNVFLSVTDTTDMWFTDSLKHESDGKKVVNTAVSRAKKRLIIVCDYNYWIKQKTQLIGKLLSVAEELKV